MEERRPRLVDVHNGVVAYIASQRFRGAWYGYNTKWIHRVVHLILGIDIWVFHELDNDHCRWLNDKQTHTQKRNSYRLVDGYGMCDTSYTSIVLV